MQSSSSAEDLDDLAFGSPTRKSSALSRPRGGDPRRISRDEMNLAEFPLTVLSTRASTNVKTLEFSDSIKGKSGELLERHWIITGADKFGLPTSSDDEVLLGLLKLTVDDGFRDRKIYFTRYELLRALRWTTEGRSYSRLQKALDRLSGVRIKATNAFYDNESKLHSTRNFGLIDAYEINDGRDLSPKPSYFTWSEVLFKSFQVGFIKKFDLDFYLSLESAVSKRLYRYLDKHFWYRSTIKINLFTLAHEKVGISRNYHYASSLRQHIDPACEELIRLGFLGNFNYQGKGKATEIIFEASGASKARSLAAKRETAQSSLDGSEPAAASPQSQRPESQLQGVYFRDPDRAALDRSLDRPHKSQTAQAYDLEQALVSRGLALKQASKIIHSCSPGQLGRVEKIIEHYDQLILNHSRRVSRSPVGFLYRAVENPEKYVLPGEEGGGRQGQLLLQQPVRPTPKLFKAADPCVGNKESLEGDYLVERKRQLLRLRNEVEPEMISKMEQDVEKALVKVRALISADRFKEAVDHGVEERLAKLFALATFEEWLANRSS